MLTSSLSYSASVDGDTGVVGVVAPSLGSERSGSIAESFYRVEREDETETI